jgi:integrase
LRASQCVVYSRKRGTWHFKWFENGQPRRRQLGTIRDLPTREDAEKAAKASRKSEKSVDLTPPTVRQLVEKFTAEWMPERFSTRYGYQCWIKNHILPKWGNQPFTELKARAVNLWLKSLPLAPKSRVHIRGVIARLWKFAMYAEIVPREVNPMKLVEIPGATKSTRKPRSITVEEFRLFLEKLEEPYRTMALLSISLGLRISETLGLKWGDVDWLDSTLQIVRGMVRQHEGSTKTDDSERKMAVDPDMLLVLNSWRRATQFPSDEDWMFASPAQLGRLPWSYPHVWRKVMEAARDAGIGKLSPHDLRHSYRAWLDDSGAPPTMQQLLMRHSDIRTTMSYGKRRRVTPEMRQAHSKVVQLALPKQ